MYCVRIRNKRHAAYLCEQTNQVKYCPVHADNPALVWVVEENGTCQRLRNQVTGNYLALEHQYPHVESIPIEADWQSANWYLERVDEAYLIRSAWRTWQFLHIAVLDGFVQYGGTVLDEVSAHWVLEVVE